MTTFAMLASELPTPLAFSDSDLSAMLAAEQAGCDPGSPSYALIARILKEDRASTPDADLRHLQTLFEHEAPGNSDVITVKVRRNPSGGAGFAFDRESLKITCLPKDRRYPNMQVGDTIVAVNEESVSTVAEYNRLARGVPDFRLGLRRAPCAVPPPPSAPAARPKPKAKAAGARPRPVAHAEWEAMAMDIDGMGYEELLALEERLGNVVQPGLRNNAIDRLPVEQVEGGGGECAICLEDFCDGDEIMRLPCLHTYHANCCRDWLQRQAKCPCCNGEVKL